MKKWVAFILVLLFPIQSAIAIDTVYMEECKKVVNFIFEASNSSTQNLESIIDNQRVYRLVSVAGNETHQTLIQFPEDRGTEHLGNFKVYFDMGNTSYVNFERARQVDNVIYSILCDWCHLRYPDDVMKNFSERILMFLYGATTQSYSWKVGKLSLTLSYDKPHNCIMLKFLY